MTEQYAYNESIPLVIRRGELERERDSYSIKLAGVELGLHLAAGGFKLEFIEHPDVVPSQPTVTLTFAPGTVDVDLDAEVIRFARSNRRRRFFRRG